MIKQQHATPASAAAILFQAYRLILLGGEAGVSVLYFELHDDASALLKDYLKVQQHKLSVNPESMLTDNSEEIWKTLNNWLNVQKTYSGTAKTIQFTIVTNTPPSEASPLVALLAKEDKSREEVDECYRSMGVLRDAKRTKATEKGKKAAVDRYIESVMSQPEFAVKTLIERTNVLFANRPYDDSDLTDLAGRLRLTKSEDRDKIVDGLMGWVCRCLVDAIMADRPPEITIEAFNNQLNELKKAHGALRQHRLRSKGSISTAERTSSRPSRTTFLDRLEDVELRDSYGTRATEHYCTFKAELLRLCHDGLIIATSDESDADNYYQELYDRWEAKFLSGCTLELGPIPAGRRIYIDTTDISNSNGITLGNIPVGGIEYFFEGVLHALANEEKVGLEIYWHPERKKSSSR